jgi:hypothetical protein
MALVLGCIQTLGMILVVSLFIQVGNKFIL